MDNLKNDVDWMVILADDLERQIDPKGNSIGKCPDGKEGEAEGRGGKRFCIS